MMELPAGWSTGELRELYGPGGIVSDGDWVESKDQDPDGDVRLIQLMDIGDGEFLDKSQRFLTSEAATRLRCTYLEPGDVLVARMPDPLGRACIFPGVGQPAVTAVDVLIWRPGQDGLDAEWVVHAINSPEIRARIALEAGGTTRQRIAGGRLKRLTLPVPPLAEQRRIVAKLDRLSAKRSAAEGHLARISKLAARAKQSILAAALYPQDAPMIELGQLAEDVRYGTSKKCDYNAGATPVLRIPNVAQGRIDASDLKHADFDARETAKLALRAGDLLLIRSNGSLDLVGRTALVHEDYRGYLFAGYLIRIRLDQAKSDPQFVQYVLSSDASRRFIERLAKSTSGVNNINSAQIASIPVPDVGPEEQAEIVRRIEAAFARIDRLTEEVSRASHLLARLDERLLAKAFRGELVPQDPTDEPAEALLDRIRAGRAVGPTTRRRRSHAATR